MVQALGVPASSEELDSVEESSEGFAGDTQVDPPDGKALEGEFKAPGLLLEPEEGTGAGAGAGVGEGNEMTGLQYRVLLTTEAVLSEP